MQKIMLGIAAVALLTTPAHGQSFVGEWLATAHSPEGSFSERLSVKRTDGGYTIQVRLVQPLPPGTPEAAPPTEISLNGDRFAFRRSVTDTITVTYSGIVSGNAFDGTVDIAGFQIPYTGVRVPDEQSIP